MAKRAFVIHCWEGLPDTRWYPWLKSELAKKGFNAQVPLMPDTEHPRMVPWLNKMKEVIGTPDKDCYLIGHSVGCIAILRYLESLKPGEKVGGIVLVAGYTSDLGFEDLKSFYKTDIDWKKIKSHCDKFIAIHSDNDPYVSLHYADFFKAELNAKIIVEHAKGHFSTKDGPTLQSALDSVMELSGKK